MEQTPGIKKIREVRALCERSSARRKTGLFVTEGERICDEIPGEDIIAIYMSESYRREHPDGRCDYLLKDQEFLKLADTRHPQGILAVVKQRVFKPDDLPEGEKYIILETLQDPGNLGTILRTAEAAGVSALIMNKGCADIYSPKVVRSTMGSIFRVPFIYVEELAPAVNKLKESGVTVYAADIGGESIYNTRLAGKRAFIIGNEGNGLTKKARDLADKVISIPMAGKVESLNAAVSAALLMYAGK